MPRASDLYSVPQAAQVLGVTERRVRQLVTSGALPGHRDDGGVTRIPQQAVNEERKRRRLGPAGGRPMAAGRSATMLGAVAAGADLEQLAAAVASAVAQRLEGHLEITQRAESLARQELDRERARSQELEARMAETEVKLAEALAESAQGRHRLGQANLDLAELGQRLAASEGRLAEMDRSGSGRRGLFGRRRLPSGADSPAPAAPAPAPPAAPTPAPPAAPAPAPPAAPAPAPPAAPAPAPPAAPAPAPAQTGGPPRAAQSAPRRPLRARPQVPAPAGAAPRAAGAGAPQVRQGPAHSQDRAQLLDRSTA